MKIYIDWEKQIVYKDEEELIEDLKNNLYLISFDQWLESRFSIDEVFSFSERKKEEIKKEYEENLGTEFEREYKRGNLDHLTIIEISSETEITLEEK